MCSGVQRGVQYEAKFTSIDSAVKKHVIRHEVKRHRLFHYLKRHKTFQRRCFARNAEICFIVSGSEGTYIWRVHIEH